MSVWTIVVAAGSGTRFGGEKQFALIGGERVIDRSVAVAKTASDGVVVVVAPAQLQAVESSIAVDAVVEGGATRSASVRAGLSAVPAAADIIVVHDAARPLASVELYEAVIAAVANGADAAIPGVEVVDTIKRVSRMPTAATSSLIKETVDRSELLAVQTPQAFNAGSLRRAHAADAEASDDAGLIEAAGGVVVAVKGARANQKITLPEDLVAMEAVMNR